MCVQFIFGRCRHIEDDYRPKPVSHGWFTVLYLVQVPSFRATSLRGHFAIHHQRTRVSAGLDQDVVTFGLQYYARLHAYI